MKTMKYWEFTPNALSSETETKVYVEFMDGTTLTTNNQELMDLIAAQARFQTTW